MEVAAAGAGLLPPIRVTLRRRVNHTRHLDLDWQSMSVHQEARGPSTKSQRQT